MAKKTTAKKTTAKKKKAASNTKKPAAKKSVLKSSAKTKKPAVKKAVKKAAATKNKPSKSQRDKLIQKIKQNLVAQRESLLKEAEDTLSALPSELNFPDMGDQATAETDRNFMLRLRDRERMLLKKIEEAVERIDNHTYGICDGCCSQIGTKRLEASPVTDLCIECKTRQEEEERITEG